MTIQWRLRFCAVAGFLLACSMLASCAITRARSDPMRALLEVPQLLTALDEIATVGDIKRSFIFQAVDLLFPVDMPADNLPPLDEKQQERINRFFASRISGVQKNAAHLVATHPQYMGQHLVAPGFSGVKFLFTGQPEAVVDADGILFVDIRIVQSVLRSIVAHWYQSGGFEGRTGGLFAMALMHKPQRFDFVRALEPQTTDRERLAIAEFNRFRVAIKDAAPTMKIGVWLHILY